MLSEKRHKRVTSSRIAAIVGVDKYRGPHGVWRDMMGLEGSEGTRATRRGIYLEEPVMGMASEDIGMPFYKPDFRVHPEHDWAGDSMDYVLHSVGDLTPKHGAEVKTCAVGVSKQYGAEGTEDVPEQVMIQCQWHLLHWPEVPDIVCPMLGGYDLDVKLYWVQRDEEMAELLLEAGEKFWRDHIKGGKEPPADRFDNTKDWLNENLKANDAEIMDVSPEMRALLVRRMDVADRIKAVEANMKPLTEMKGELNNQIRQLMGTAKRAVSDEYSVSNSYVPPTTYTASRKGYYRMNVHRKGGRR